MTNHTLNRKKTGFVFRQQINIKTVTKKPE